LPLKPRRRTDFHPHDRFVSHAVLELARIERQIGKAGNTDFQGHPIVTRLREMIPWEGRTVPNDEPSKALFSLLHEPDFIDLLPFILERFNSATGFIELPNRGPHRNRDRKVLDSFYTPLDLARWLTSLTSSRMCAAITSRLSTGKLEDAHEALSEILNLRICDMSCGAGILLREALGPVKSAYKQIYDALGERECRRFEGIAPLFSHGFVKLQALLSNVYGVDIAPCAVEAARTLLIVWAGEELQAAHISAEAVDELLQLNIRVGSGSHWSKGIESVAKPSMMNWLVRAAMERENHRRAILGFIDARLVHPDSNGSDGPEIEIIRMFPEVFANQNPGFACIVGNPPFGKLPDGMESSEKLWSLNCHWQYPRFVEGMYRFTRRDGFSAIVTPLNLAYGREFSNLRSMIETVPVQSTFTFFDRSPDALFGDKVKTRTIVLALAPSKRNAPELRTTHLLRWTRTNRANLWGQIEPVTLTSVGIQKLVPKLGTPLEAECWKNLRSRLKTLRNVVLNSASEKPVDASVYVNATAYNWLPAFRHVPATASLVSPSIRAYVFRTAVEADLIYSCLVSSLAFWLWTVESDGFHLTDGFILSLPFVPEIFSEHETKLLSELGQAHVFAIRSNPTIKSNAGLKVLNFNRQSAAHISREIDAVMARALGLPREFLDIVHERVMNLVYAGRNQTRATAKSGLEKERYAKVC